MVREKQLEKSKNLRKKEKSQEILTGCSNLKVLALLRFNLMISVSSKMLYQKVREISLRSGRSQGKVRENKSRKKWPPCVRQN